MDSYSLYSLYVEPEQIETIDLCDDGEEDDDNNQQNKEESYFRDEYEGIIYDDDDAVEVICLQEEEELIDIEQDEQLTGIEHKIEARTIKQDEVNNFELENEVILPGLKEGTTCLKEHEEDLLEELCLEEENSTHSNVSAFLRFLFLKIT